MKTILEQLQILIHNQTDIPLNNLLPNKKPKSDFNLDSLDFVELIMAVEDEFNISINEDSFDLNITIAQFVLLIDKLILTKEVVSV